MDAGDCLLQEEGTRLLAFAFDALVTPLWPAAAAAVGWLAMPQMVHIPPIHCSVWPCNCNSCWQAACPLEVAKVLGD